MCKRYRNTGSLISFCLCIVFTQTGPTYAHCELALPGEITHGYLATAQYIQPEVQSRLSLAKSTWPLGWYFVDGTRTGMKCSVADSNAALRQRKQSARISSSPQMKSANGYETSSRLSLTSRLAVDCLPESLKISSCTKKRNAANGSRNSLIANRAELSFFLRPSSRFPGSFAYKRNA